MRPEEWVMAGFPPGYPLAPQPLDVLRPDTGLPEPRLYQYPVSVNLPGGETRFRSVDWATLKKASESPIFRNCIEIRKSAIAALDYTVRPSQRYIDQQVKQTGQAKNEIEAGIRDKYRDQIERGLNFWAMPDPKNGHDFPAWVSMLMDEHLTWDAIAIYPHKTYGGDLLGLWILDGSTIKPLLDETGGRPVAPEPAYQQILYGFPRGEFTADTVDVNGKLVVPGGLSAAQLVYERKTKRSYTPYGFSPTEQALLDGLLWNKRFQWMMAEYTEGASPVSFLVNKGQTDWTPEQLLTYERILNDKLAGQTGERMRNHLLPVGIEPGKDSSIPERYRPDYDMFILKLVLAHFDVDISEYGFTEGQGLGSSGYHEGKADLQFRKATLPTSKWLNGILTRLQTNQLGLPPELEFSFLGLESEDEAAADAVAENRVKSGRNTLNEDRARQGLPPYQFKEANMAMLETQRGVVFLDGSSDLVPAGVMLEPASEHPNVQGDDLDSDNAPVAKPSQPKAKAKPNVTKAVEEVSAYRKWAGKRGGSPRPFRFEHLTAELAKDLGFDPDLPVEYAGDADPKVTQESVNLRLAMGQHQCGNCSMFQEQARMCDLGFPTTFDQVCDRWESKASGTSQGGSETGSWSPYSVPS